MVHTIVAGQSVSSFDLLIADEEPLHAQRRASYNKLVSEHSLRPAALAPHDAQLEQTLRKLSQVARKRLWLRALLYEDPDDDPTTSATGGRPRSLDSFAETLLASQLHASRHGLHPGALRRPLMPPPLLGEDPPVADAAWCGFDASWASWAVRCFLADNQRRRRQPVSSEGRAAQPLA